MRKSQDDLRLLPRVFNKVAIGLLLASILVIVLFVSKIIVLDKEKVKAISSILFLMSLLIFAFTRSKNEDELSFRIRLKSLAAAFVAGVVYVIVMLFMAVLSGGNILEGIGPVQVLSNMFFIYFVFMFVMKRNR